LTVPCCHECNSAGEKILETPLSAALSAGYEAVRKIPAESIALWCLKIYYGIRFKEHVLPHDRRKPLGRRITKRKEIEELDLLFLVMQGIRRTIKYPTSEPWTMWLYKVKVPSRIEEQFSFSDITGLNMFSIRIADVGIVMMPRDFGLVKRSDYADFFNYLTDKELHPQQLNEIAARAAYLDAIREIGVTYAIDFNDPVQVVWLGSMATRPWREWNLDEYSKILAFITKIPYAVWHPRQNLQWSLLYDDNDHFMDVPLSKLPSIVRGDESWDTSLPDNKV
jgi:hypothetical protein